MLSGDISRGIDSPDWTPTSNELSGFGIFLLTCTSYEVLAVIWNCSDPLRKFLFVNRKVNPGPTKLFDFDTI